jgi:mycothiol synthase
MPLTIEPFVAREASESELKDYVEVRSAAAAVDMPEDAPLTYEAHVGRLLSPPTHLGECMHWAARIDGRLVGLAQVGRPGEENSGLALVDVWVHPDVRREGIGTGLMEAALSGIANSGREKLLGVLKAQSAGARWIEYLGCRVVHRTVVQRLNVASVSPHVWDAPPPAGYRLAQWVGAAPENLLAGYAAARPAVQDAPTGMSTFRQPEWTPERIRRSEQDLAAQGVEERVVVAIEDSTDRVVGVTSMIFYPHRPEHGYQGDTSVVIGHRGHGLGRVMKSAMMRWIVAERPAVELILTTTAEVNKYMIDVNLAVGYETVRSIIYVDISTARLAEKLSGR